MKNSKKLVTPILAALIASSAIVTTSATADASTASVILGKTAKVIGKETFSGCFHFGTDVALSALFGMESSESELSDQSLAEIGDLMNTALANYSTTTALNNLDTVIVYSDEYERDTASTISINYWLGRATTITDASQSVIDTLNDDGYEVASSYQSLASMRLAFLKEQYELMRAYNSVSGTTAYGASSLQSIVGSLDGVTTRGSIRNRAADYYDDLSAMEADWQVYMSTHFMMDQQNVSKDWSNYEGAYVYREYYCIKDSSNVKHCGSQFRCVGGTGTSQCNTETRAAAKVTANELRVGVGMLERDDELGESIDDNLDYLSETDSYGIEYCGNGRCALGEIDSCSADCYSMTSSAAGTVVTNGAIDLSSSQARTLLSNSKAHLDWTSTGNLVLYATSGYVLWSTNLAANTANVLKFQTDGNLVLYGPGGPKYATGSNATGNRMVLVGRELHIVNSSNTTLWSSNRLYQSGTFGNSQTITLAWNNDAKLLWQSDGNLAIYRSDNSMAWGSGTNGLGTQLVISGGTITIKNSAGTVVWSNFGSVSRPNSYIELVGDSLRSRVTSGGYSSWSSGSCTLSSCKDDRNDIDKSIGYCFDTSQAHTLMSNDDATLNWQSDGNLVILNASGSPRWAAGTGGYIGKYVCFQNDGNLVIYDSDWTAKWAASNMSSAVFGATRLSLDSCNLSVTNSTGKVLYGTNVNCY